MVYLDYSASTPVDKEVMDSFIKCNNEFIGNANSLHKLGIKINALIEASTTQIQNLLNADMYEVIYTSGATESNNLAITGYALSHQNRGKHIITSRYEHSSVNYVIDYLKSLGFEISYAECDEDGVIDLNNLRDLIREDTILVSICAVNSEIGILQPTSEIARMLKERNVAFHCDMTQAIGKVKIDITNIDMITISAHKIYGIKGVGCLLKKDSVNITPQILGGKSTTKYRSGTPSHPLIVSFSKALRLAVQNLDERYKNVVMLSNYLKTELRKREYVSINSNSKCIPHIINISIKAVKPETMLHSLEQEDIYISTKTACSDNNNISESVYYLTKDEERAKTSLRISISHLTTPEEVEYFIKCLDKCYFKLK